MTNPVQQDQYANLHLQLLYKMLVNGLNKEMTVRSLLTSARMVTFVQQAL